jgi:hypothetical protein
MEEELLEGCCAFLQNVVLQNNIFDRWLWRRDHSFLVKEVYSTLTRIEDVQRVN